jgi:hypothetical protein
MHAQSFQSDVRGGQVDLFDICIMNIENSCFNELKDTKLTLSFEVLAEVLRAHLSYNALHQIPDWWH